MDVVEKIYDIISGELTKSIDSDILKDLKLIHKIEKRKKIIKSLLKNEEE